MLLYTVMPEEVIFGEDDDEEGRDAAPVDVMVSPRGGRVFVQAIGGRAGRIVGVLSTDPRDYLDPALAPGRIVSMPADHPDVP